ncbi:valine--tRNA ligase [Candidatus Woesearchaeota archaeon]|nr:valine--tRNA ligase [Candidatus Woesearchaeota archaeon]
MEDKEKPQDYDPLIEEPKWQKFWEDNNIYRFDPDSKAEVYSVDTPPPTVSGKMHLGHSFSYSQQDFIVRFQRMIGKNVFYPFGTDDNGLATERLIEKTKGVRAKDMNREEFVRLCLNTLEKELRPKYIADWKRIGMSCEWGIFYTTINEHCQRISQREFISLYNKGRAYRKDAPTMWCPECHTGISQVECVDQEIASNFCDIVFKSGGKDLIIATTRPELLPACVAVFYHPEDKRYQALKGKKAEVPLFGFEVPILEDVRADTEKGTGLVMCCTFGDQTDMEWQKAHDLPIKEAITHDGKMTALAGRYQGEQIKKARKMIIEDMKQQGLLRSMKPIKHAVNVHERCGTEIEFIKAKQWFIRYLDLKDDMLKWGEQLNWYPSHMRNRYENWVKGLQWDWLVSRQRYSGVPFPVWYCSKCDETIMADGKELPVDPINSRPPVKACPKCGSTEFTPEKDILDTWATSSLTPRLAVELMPDDIQPKLFPMSLRPQAHDIITFWLFNTTFRSNMAFGCNPWKDCVISGWALDPHGKKMSKSKGNVIEPQVMIDRYGADALRFWAAGSKLGDDLPFQEKDLVTGKKMVNKLWNASKFSIMHLKDFDYRVTAQKANLRVMDRWVLSRLQRLIKDCTDTFSNYEYAKSKAETEKFFWGTICDNYLEVCKDRLYNPDKRGAEAKAAAQFTLYQLLLNILKLVAPVMPHVTEAVYQSYFAGKENDRSIHISRWPEVDESLVDEGAEKAGELVIAVIGAVRKFKSEQKVSLKKPVKLVVECDDGQRKMIESALEDLTSTANAVSLVFGKGDIDIPDQKVKVGVALAGEN